MDGGGIITKWSVCPEYRESAPRLFVCERTRELPELFLGDGQEGQSSLARMLLAPTWVIFCSYHPYCSRRLASRSNHPPTIQSTMRDPTASTDGNPWGSAVPSVALPTFLRLRGTFPIYLFQSHP
jgi:hypothetical protein